MVCDRVVVESHRMLECQQKMIERFKFVRKQGLFEVSAGCHVWYVDIEVVFRT